VFLLGAGASWHYGYPTGEELVKKVEATAREVANFCRQSHRIAVQPRFVKEKTTGGSTKELENGWYAAAAECEELAVRLQRVNPLVIDYFLGLNRRLENVGKLMISLVLLRCEAKFLEGAGNINRKEALEKSPLKRDREEGSTVNISLYKDDWYRFILHRLVTDCPLSIDLLKKNVSFVTFNYDVSLEYVLWNGLRAIEFFDPKDVDEFFSPKRVLHIYGKIRDYPKEDVLKSSVDWDQLFPNSRDLDRENWENSIFVLDEAYEASANLKVIDPHTKADNSSEISAAIEAINTASVVYILGYGFDKNNNKRIGLNASLLLNENKSPKCVMFANFGNSDRINKSSSRLFFGKIDQFGISMPFAYERGGYYYEKSIRDVYQALEMDFDSLEDQFGAGSPS